MAQDLGNITRRSVTFITKTSQRIHNLADLFLKIHLNISPICTYITHVFSAQNLLHVSIGSSVAHCSQQPSPVPLRVWADPSSHSKDVNTEPEIRIQIKEISCFQSNFRAGFSRWKCCCYWRRKTNSTGCQTIFRADMHIYGFLQQVRRLSLIIASGWDFRQSS